MTTAADPTLKRISVETDGAVVRVGLRNPPLNVIDIPMMEELTQVLAELEAQASTSLIVICGAGKAFSAGVDIGAHSPDKVEGMLAKFHGVIRALIATRGGSFAAVHRLCLGGGAELA